MKSTEIGYQCLICFQEMPTKKRSNMYEHINLKHFNENNNIDSEESDIIKNGESQMYSNVMNNDQSAKIVPETVLKQEFEQESQLKIKSDQKEKQRGMKTCNYCNSPMLGSNFESHVKSCKIYHEFMRSTTIGYQCLICLEEKPTKKRSSMYEHIKLKHFNENTNFGSEYKANFKSVHVSRQG